MIEPDNKLASTKRQGYKQKGKGKKKPENKGGFFDYSDYDDPFFNQEPIYKKNDGKQDNGNNTKK